MKYVFSNLMVFNCICAVLTAFSIIVSKKKKDKTNILQCLFSLASAIWSLGFGMLFIQTDVKMAYFWRSFGIFGTVMYMIVVQQLICIVSEMPRKPSLLFKSFSFVGVVAFILSVLPGQTSYYISRFGMTYKFTPGLINIFYTTYFVIVSVNIIIVIVYMIKFAKPKRIRTIGKHFLIVATLIICGTILDMIFPALGYDALPGSNVTQFFGMLIMHYALYILNQSMVSDSNLSKYIYSALGVPILVFDSAYKLRITNDAANKFLGTDENDAQDRSLTDFFRVKIPKDELIEKKHISVDCRDSANNIPCNLTISALFDRYDDVMGYIVIAKNLTERMQYIEALEKARKDADTSNKSKTVFLANMSHEIRTPMNAIIGFSELILKQNPDRNTVLDYVENIRDSSYSLLSLINDILDISKIESGKMELIETNYRSAKVISDVIRDTRLLADKKGLKFEVDYDKDIPCELQGDENKIKEILINVLNNAVKYTDRGKVELVIRKGMDLGNDRIMMNVYVSDTGRGIKKENQEYIFKAFEQVDKVSNRGIEGTGLGLSIVKGYIELMEGSVEVHSEFGKGTTFVLHIPQTVINPKPIGNPKIEEETDKKSKIGDIKFDGIRVLVVDDNKVNIIVIKQILKGYGFEVDTAVSGMEAIEKCAENNYRIVFMDQMMPEMDGVEAMHIIKDKFDYYNSEGKIIALTANAIKGVKEILIKEGFDAYIKKPVEFDELEDVLVNFITDSRVEENG